MLLRQQRRLTVHPGSKARHCRSESAGCSKALHSMERMQAHAWVVWAQTRFFPRYPNYKNVSVNMFNAGYPADKARRCISA